MKAMLVYKSYISGELSEDAIGVIDASEAEKIMRQLIECMAENNADT